MAWLAWLGRIADGREWFGGLVEVHPLGYLLPALSSSLYQAVRLSCIHLGLLLGLLGWLGLV